MIVIDTSALVAILNHEPERTAFYEIAVLSVPSPIRKRAHQEAGHVLIAKRGVNGLYDLEDFLAPVKAEIIPHDVNLARRYGKGIDLRRGSISAIAPMPLPKR